MELTCGVPGTAPSAKNKADVAVFSTFRQPNLMVNVQGERFLNEETLGNPTYTGNAVSRQKGGCAFLIFDAGILEYYENNGFDWVNSPPTKMQGLAENLVEISGKARHIFSADSLKELAEKTGINFATLQKTVEDYNRSCETGRDKIFFKRAKYLKPVKKGPFFAGRYYPSAYGTLGGIKINYKTEVVTDDSDVIPGLYAAGVDACSIFFDSYIFIFPGSTMGFCINSGRIAGRNAADYARSF